MAYVISLEGSHGVGKSTLIDSLKESYPNAIFYDEQGIKTLQRMKAESLLNMNIESEYYQIQKWYIDYELKRFKSFNKNDFAFIVRGPELKEFFYFNYPKTIGQDWEIEKNFGNQLAQYRTHCQSNRILFLDASVESLKQRILESGRPRKNIEEWFRDWYTPYSVYFKAHPKSFVVDTEKLKKEETFDICVNWIDKIYNEFHGKR